MAKLGMTPDGMAAAVMTALGTDTKIAALSATQQAEVKAGITALCAAIVDYIQANMLVTVDAMTAVVQVMGAAVSVTALPPTGPFGTGFVK